MDLCLIIAFNPLFLKGFQKKGRLLKFVVCNLNLVYICGRL